MQHNQALTPGPIGIFDSGYGGLTIMKEIVHALPQYDYLYLGDNARTPYGNRSFETVYEYTLQCVKLLFEQGCNLVILACNTASAKALRNIQQKDLPQIAPNKRVLGVIRPTAELIGSFSTSGHIGVCATEGTVSSESYLIEIGKFFPHAKVVQEACSMWVPIVENNMIETPGTEYFVKHYIQSLLAKDELIDTILLGCTHYPLLMDTIRKYVPSQVSLISQGPIVAAALQSYLSRHPHMEENCTKIGSRQFFTTDDPAMFSKKASIFYGEQVQANHIQLV
jgi:glutamate racemase